MPSAALKNWPPEVAAIAPLDIRDHAAIVGFCRENAIDLVVPGPEAPLVAGIADDLEAAGRRQVPSSSEGHLGRNRNTGGFGEGEQHERDVSPRGKEVLHSQCFYYWRA